MLPIPKMVWQREVRKRGQGMLHRLSFMSDEHHRVRDFVVLELPRAGEPLSPERIARALNLPLDRTITILDELERNMTFLFRNEGGAVVWAYPVTVEPTPHRVTFSSGERVYAA
jgi:hypothetical protein